MTISYDDADKAHTVSQVGATTTDMRDLNGRVMQVSTTGVTAVTQVNHDTDGSDNPTWVDTTGSGPGTTVTSREGDCISGDLGARIVADGSASIPLATPHGDVVTTAPVGETQTNATPSTSCSGWVDHTEYGLPNNPATGGNVGGDWGHGWLGAKHRSTTTVFSAGPTLMGDRLYDPVRGIFTSLDPTPGGNTTAYTYPQDPINRVDLDGHWGWGWLSTAAKVVGAVAAGVCIVASAGACAIVGAAAFAASAINHAHAAYSHQETWKSALFNVGVDALTTFAPETRFTRYATRGLASQLEPIGRHGGGNLLRFVRTAYRGRHAVNRGLFSGVSRGFAHSVARYRANWLLHPGRALTRHVFNGALGWRSWNV